MRNRYQQDGEATPTNYTHTPHTHEIEETAKHKHKKRQVTPVLEDISVVVLIEERKVILTFTITSTSLLCRSELLSSEII